eukprot:760974-Hanusia_phi.AAC.1
MTPEPPRPYPSITRNHSISPSYTPINSLHCTRYIPIIDHPTHNLQLKYTPRRTVSIQEGYYVGSEEGVLKGWLGYQRAAGEGWVVGGLLGARHIGEWGRRWEKEG